MEGKNGEWEVGREGMGGIRGRGNLLDEAEGIYTTE